VLYLLGGFAVLSGFLLLVYLFVNADPARLARGLKVTGIVIAVAAVATLAISGRLAAILMPLAMLMPLLIRVRSLLDRYRPPAAGQTSTVATAFLRMTLDHDTGSMEGTILRGRFAGMRLDELGAADLLALLRECRAEDEEGARLLEAYLDRIHPQWREELAGERAAVVKAYLVKRGVSADRLVARGLGATSFIASNATADGRRQNRRIELVVVRS